MIETRTRLNWRYLLDYSLVAFFLGLLALHAAGDSVVLRLLGEFAALYTTSLIVPGTPTRDEVVT